MKADFHKLARAFNPEVIAIVGDKGETGYTWIKSQSNFKGKLYSVQIDPREIPGIEELGVTNYKSIMDIPEPVDLAIVAVPREVLNRVLDDLIRKDVAAAHVYTAGFSETATPEGLEIERVMVEKAEAAGFHIIGPNCMGLLNPSAGLGRSVREGHDAGPGEVGFISQSGMHVFSFAREAHLEGVELNKSVSYGNGTLLDATDYLNFFGRDDSVKAIGLYLDGVRDIRRFSRVLAAVSARKPVVVWKGGRTADGDRAVASHSASAAVPYADWQRLIAGTGAVSVRNMEQLIDTLKALLYFPAVRGDAVAVTGGSGGQSVAAADAFAEAGLRVPLLTEKSQAEFGQFFSLIGGSFQNPVDTANINRTRLPRILDILGRDDNIDSLALLLNSRSASSPQFEAQADALAAAGKANGKPALAVLSWSFADDDVKQARQVIEKLRMKGVPVFLSLERAAFAVKKAYEYHAKKKD